MGGMRLHSYQSWGHEVVWSARRTLSCTDTVLWFYHYPKYPDLSNLTVSASVKHQISHIRRNHLLKEHIRVICIHKPQYKYKIFTATNNTRTCNHLACNTMENAYTHTHMIPHTYTQMFTYTHTNTIVPSPSQTRVQHKRKVQNSNFKKTALHG